MHETVSAAIREQLEKWAVPGMSLATLVDGKVETAVAGVSSAVTQTPVRTDTLFQIGSISKIFTTTLLMTFVDDGLVDLDAPVLTWLPDLALADPAARANVTPRQLVTHHGGFYGDRFDDHGAGDDALARAIEAIGDLEQQTAPGELWTYCNLGFDITARIIEVVGGKPFETLMAERVFAPLGMDSATYFASEAIRHPVAVGHEGEGDALAVSWPWPVPRRSAGAGGVIATPTQMLAFAAMHLGDGAYGDARVLSAESARAMQAGQAPSDPFRTWGLGWSRNVIGGEFAVEHGGATNGFRAKLLVLPERKAAIALLSNHENGGAAMGAVTNVWLEETLGITGTRRTGGEADAAVLDTRAGSYRQGLADLVLTRAGDGFDVAQVTHSAWNESSKEGKPFHLRALSDDVFVAEGGLADGLAADFIRADDGSVRFFRFGGRLHRPVSA